MSEKIILTSIDQKELFEIIRNAVEISLVENSQKTAPGEDLLTFKQTYEMLKIHPSTLNKYKSEGRIPYKRLGKRIFFDRNEVLAALDSVDNTKYKILK